MPVCACVFLQKIESKIITEVQKAKDTTTATDRVLPNHDRPRSSRLERNRLSFSKSKGIDAGLYGECPSWCYGVYFCVLGDSFSKGVVTQQHSQQRAILHDLPSSSLTKESNKNLLHTLPRVSHSIVLTCIFKDTTERTLPTKGYLI